MAYVSSNDNRFYVALEQEYGQISAITNVNRIPAIKLATRQRPDKTKRTDKTGSRTYPGMPGHMRKNTVFDLRTYMTTWVDQTTGPPYGLLFQACLGARPLLWSGASITSIDNGNRVSFGGPHNLVPGQAVSTPSEIRFVNAIIDNNTVELNAPFNVAPIANSTLGPTITYRPAADLGSVSIFDFWTPIDSVHRILSGAAVNRMKIRVNGDFHEFDFSGPARDILDSTSFEYGESALASFPGEPSLAEVGYVPVPGHLGEIWLGSAPSQFFTITNAELTLDNNLELRAREFGTTLPRAISPGMRSVVLDFSLYQDTATSAGSLYQAARQRSPVSVMLQLGQQQTQLFGVYLQSVILEVPDFDDSDMQQQWTFQNCRAQGYVNDEIVLAFA